MSAGAVTLSYFNTYSYAKFIVPTFVTKITVTLYAASGGDVEDPRGYYGGTVYGGSGGMISADITVVPGETYYIYVGGQGDQYGGGYNGGGPPSYSGSGATGGGGATDFRKSTSLGDRLLVAGGGGGASAACGGNGGYGGYPQGKGGGDGTYCPEYYYGSDGGTQSGPGMPTSLYCDPASNGGTFGLGGMGCLDYNGIYGSGGGGGYFGGAGNFGAGAGGGSSYSAFSSFTYNNAMNSGDGFATIVYSLPASSGSTYQYSGGPEMYTVPSGVTSLQVELHGAAGGCDSQSTGGLGGMISAILPVTPGEVLAFYVGGIGGSVSAFNGGGAPTQYLPGGGGGATDIRRSPYALANRLLIAGGGGGCYSGCLAAGGGGGYPTGIKGFPGSACSSYPGGSPGTQNAGGAVGNLQYCVSTTNAGSLGLGGDGCGNSGSGGGGGYYGGGSDWGGGGGGGSSYASVGTFTFKNSENSGYGYAIILNAPTYMPTQKPIVSPTLSPTIYPTLSPTTFPSTSPSRAPTATPTASPTLSPTASPTASPTTSPSLSPTAYPTLNPTVSPTPGPTVKPTMPPSLNPTAAPSAAPTASPSNAPTPVPTVSPSLNPSLSPTANPSATPTLAPTLSPSLKPTTTPTASPTLAPTQSPTCQPTASPSAVPTASPTATPSAMPTCAPTATPSNNPTPSPTCSPSAVPTAAPTCAPTANPTLIPTCKPTASPSAVPTSQPSSTPTRQPTARPTGQPSGGPSSQPSRQPSRQPTGQPSGTPTRQPSGQPSGSPSRQPSSQPSRQPTSQPTSGPSTQPTSQPSGSPSRQPTGQPSRQPTGQPSCRPTSQPSGQPSSTPTKQPSSSPTSQPSSQPSGQPSMQPSRQPSSQPTGQPSVAPTTQPSGQPTGGPTRQPSSSPTSQPSEQPTRQPSGQPSGSPSRQPSGQPSSSPTRQPTGQPSCTPTCQPSNTPTSQPSSQPSNQPSGQPSVQPTRQPTGQPSAGPTAQPTRQPSGRPSGQPSVAPTSQPSAQPTRQPSGQPSSQPSRQPTTQPSSHPTTQPSGQPSGVPTRQPSSSPTAQPTVQPTRQPSGQPSTQPSAHPSGQPTSSPSRQPSTQPSGSPTRQPSCQPSVAPSSQPTNQPSGAPTRQPSSQPSGQPSSSPTTQPTQQPSARPSGQPSSSPSAQPSRQPSSQPTGQPSGHPTTQPSGQPSSSPTNQPSSRPSRQPTSQPSRQPSVQPSNQPSDQPTTAPSTQPSAQPSAQPVVSPSSQPSAQPSRQPSGQPSSHPTSQPSRQPTGQPSVRPSSQPSGQPSRVPSGQPSRAPSGQPSSHPTSQPSEEPSAQPSTRPSSQPSASPSAQPTRQPSVVPSSQPSGIPTGQPSGDPTSQPSVVPSAQPSSQPSSQPSGVPSAQPITTPSTQPSSRPSTQPSSTPSGQPSRQPSSVPSSVPSAQPTAQPTGDPTGQPTTQPSALPSAQPTSFPTSQPSMQPSSAPSTQPTAQPTGDPTAQPSAKPSMLPTTQPSAVPSTQPTSFPSAQPSLQPSSAPSVQPSSVPTTQPSVQPTSAPSVQPSRQPSSTPSVQPSSVPTDQPSSVPSSRPSAQPTSQPSRIPSMQPSSRPTAQPTGQPSVAPTAQPSVHPTGQPSHRPSSQPSAQPICHPTSVPTVTPTTYQSSRFIYSKAPTAVPSFSPTLSELSVWTNKLQSVLVDVTANDTGAVAHRSTYYALNVASVTPHQRYGGCSAWSSVISGDVNPSQFLYKPRSIALRVLADDDSSDHIHSFDSRSAICNDPTITSSILAALVSPNPTGKRSFACDAHVWTVKACPITTSTSTVYAPAVCIDCADPCAATSQCSVGTDGLAVSPCVQSQCSGTTSLRVLSVAYANLETAPLIVSSNVVSSRTGLHITAQLSSTGSLFCAVYRANAEVSLPTSVTAVQLQNFVATTDSANRTVLSVTGLDASTAYKVYFMSASPIGVRTTHDQVLASVTSFNTSCCKTVTGTLAATSFIESRSFANALSLVLSARPTSALTVRLELFSVSGDTPTLLTQSLFPTVFTVSTISSIALSAALPALSVGRYEYRIVVSGSSAAEFSSAYSNNVQRFDVVTAATEPPTPTLQQPVFSADGSYLTVAFSAATNKGNTASTFICSALFDFACAATSKCQWVDAATVRAYVQGANINSCAQPTSLLSLTPAAQIKAKCQAGGDTGGGNACPNYLTWAIVTTAAQSIAAPSAPLAPKVVISAPGVLGSCDDLYLDVSGSSGSSGRPWAFSSITVLSTAGTNITALSAHLRSVVSLTPPPSIDASLFQRGINYNFHVKLCNFLGQCQVSNKQVLVLNDTLPSVSLPGAPLRSIYRKNSLVLASSAFISSCDGMRTAAGLTYRWIVSSNNVEVLSVVSTSRDPSMFLLPAYSLSTATLYTVSLSVSVAGSVQSSQVSTQVYVLPGSVVATITGGSVRSVRVGDSVNLDSSTSYDEDLTGVKGTAAGLVYLWTCAQTAPVFNSSCAGIFTNPPVAHSVLPTLSLIPRVDAAGAECEVCVTITDSQRKRSSTATTTVAVLAPLAPVVSISAPNLPATRIVNAGQLLQLTGELSVPSVYGGNATWSVSDASVDLSTALFPITSSIEAVSGTSADVISKTIYMALSGNSLPVGATLTFSLTGAIPYQGQTSIASFTVVVNAPPTPGSFYVSPSTGVELMQLFQFVALQWVDPDLPLQYQFGHVDASGLEVVLRSRLELSYGSTLLTAGTSDHNFAVTCVAQIFDSLGANSSSSVDVTVNVNAALNSSSKRSFIEASLSGAVNVDSIKQATTLSSSLLNAVNCTHAPNCSALHRQNCLSTAHTCGPCESDVYVGESGDSNEECVSKHSNFDTHRFLRSVELSSDAKEYTTKPCPADCSGHGTCTHVWRDSGAVITPSMPPCVVGAVDCVALCECDEAFMGSDTCDLPSDEFVLRQRSRSSVIAGLQTLVVLENPDEQVIGAWIGGLQLASQQPAELTEDSSLTVLSLVDTITTTAASLSTGEDTHTSLSVNTVQGLLKAINSVAAYSAKSTLRRKLAMHRRGLSDIVSSSDSVLSLTTAGVLNNFGSLVAQSMLPGQAAQDFTQGELRMSVQVLSNGAGGEGNSTAAVPLTALEKYLGVSSSSISVPAAGSVDVPVSLVVTSVRAELYSYLNADLKSNPVTLYASADLCADPPCYVDMVIQNSQAVGYAQLNTPSVHVVNITCERADHTEYEVACPDGTPMQMKCNGTAGTLHQQCPVTSYSAACNALNGESGELLSGSSSGCVVHAFTDTNVTCRCDTTHVFAQSRRLQNGNFTVLAGYSASYMSMLSATAHSFLSTLSTANDLNASTLTKGWRALATLGTLAGAIAFALFWSNYSDRQAKKVSPGSDEKAEKGPGAPVSLDVVKQTKNNKKQAKKRFKFGSRSKKVIVNAELAIVEESLPKALSSRTFSDRFLEEVKQHHRWFGIIFYFSDSFPRVLRVISLASNAIIMLFIQSITYNLTNPDDGSCGVLHTEIACLEPKSPFATGESKCGWIMNNIHDPAQGGTCTYIEPDNSVRIILFVAIFCAIVTTPIAMATDWVVRNILSAPTETEASLEGETAALNLLVQTSPLESAPASPAPSPDAVSDHKSLQVVSTEPTTIERPQLLKRKSSHSNLASYFSVFNSEMQAKEDRAILATSRAELLMLSMKLKRYREILRPDELEEFNTLWGLDDEGHFRTTAAAATTWYGRLKQRFVKQEEVNVKEAVLGDLQRINAAVQSESKALKASDVPKYEIGKKLLFLFQCDLLPGISGKILEQKGSRDFTKVKHVSVESKILGYTFLFLMNVGMLFYILLFALTQTGPRQNAWFQSFALWLVVEIFMVSTAIVFFTHILIPSLVMKDLTQIKRRLMDNIRDFNDKVSAAKANPTASNEEDDAQKISFNAANYLFVSTRLSRQFPDLKESKIIAQFSTPWPRQSYLHVQNVSKGYSKKFSALTRSASILIVFFAGNFLSVPPSVQDIAVQMTSTTAIGYFMLIHVQLYDIFPVLVILPALVAGLLVHFFIQSSKADAKIKLARLFPNRKKQIAMPSKMNTTDHDESLAVAAEVRVLGEESKYGYDSDDFSISSDDEEVEPAPVVATINPHRTRRQSINAGLNVLSALRQNQMQSPNESSSEETLSSDSENSCLAEHDFEVAELDDTPEFGRSDDTENSESESESGNESDSVSDSSSSAGDDEMEHDTDENEDDRLSSTRDVASSGDFSFSDELHVALGTPQSSPRIVSRKSSAIHVAVAPAVLVGCISEEESDERSEDEDTVSGDDRSRESDADLGDLLSAESDSDSLSTHSTHSSHSLHSRSSHSPPVSAESAAASHTGDNDVDTFTSVSSMYVHPAAFRPSTGGVGKVMIPFSGVSDTESAPSVVFGDQSAHSETHVDTASQSSHSSKDESQSISASDGRSDREHDQLGGEESEDDVLSSFDSHASHELAVVGPDEFESGYDSVSDISERDKNAGKEGNDSCVAVEPDNQSHSTLSKHRDSTSASHVTASVHSTYSASIDDMDGVLLDEISESSSAARRQHDCTDNTELPKSRQSSAFDSLSDFSQRSHSPLDAEHHQEGSDLDSLSECCSAPDQFAKSVKQDAPHRAEVETHSVDISDALPHQFRKKTNERVSVTSKHHPVKEFKRPHEVDRKAPVPRLSRVQSERVSPVSDLPDSSLVPAPPVWGTPTRPSVVKRSSSVAVNNAASIQVPKMEKK